MVNRLRGTAAAVFLGVYFVNTVQLSSGRAIGPNTRLLHTGLLAAVTVLSIGRLRDPGLGRAIRVTFIVLLVGVVGLFAAPSFDYGSDGAYLLAGLGFVATYSLVGVYAAVLFDREAFLRWFVRFARWGLALALVALALSMVTGSTLLVSTRLDTGARRLQGLMSEPSAWAPVLAAVVLLHLAGGGRWRWLVIPMAAAFLTRSPTVLLVLGASVAVWLLITAPWRSTKPLVIAVVAASAIGLLAFVQTADSGAWLGSSSPVEQTIGRLLSGIDNIRSNGERGSNDRYESTDLTFTEIDQYHLGLLGGGPDAHTVFFPAKHPAGPIGLGPRPNALWVVVAFNHGEPAAFVSVVLVLLAIVRMRRDREMAAVLLPFCIASLVNSASGFALYQFALLAVLLYGFGWAPRRDAAMVPAVLQLPRDAKVTDTQPRVPPGDGRD